MSIRRLALFLVDNIVVRWLTLAVLAVIALIDRLASRLRFLALVPTAGRTAWCHWSVQLKAPENITIGEFVTIGPYSALGAKASISIGNYVRIGRGVIIETGWLDTDARPPYPPCGKPIVIGEGVVIYANAIILGGVTIGEHSIIAAGCVVNKDVPPYHVVAQARRLQVQRSASVRRRLAGE
jgi:acetyltransferase-like isoleucine patch superfamily enzyme